MMLDRTTLEKYRIQLWIDVAVYVAQSDMSTSKTAPVAWANEALAAFDRQFLTDDLGAKNVP